MPDISIPLLVALYLCAIGSGFVSQTILSFAILAIVCLLFFSDRLYYALPIMIFYYSVFGVVFGISIFRIYTILVIVRFLLKETLTDLQKYDLEYDYCMRKGSGKSIEKNISMSVVSRIVTLITGLIVQHYILVAFGSTLNGLTSSISQVMQYLILLEAGLGTASIQAMYSPLADNDWGKISGIFTATDVEYKKIARIFMLMLFAVSLILPFAVSSEVEYKIAAVLTFVTGLSYVVGYIFGGKYKAVLSADRKMYVLYDLDILSNVLSCVFRCLALYLGAGIILVQLIHLGSICVKNIGYVAYVKRKYKNIDYKAVPDLKAIGKRWSVLIHNIAGIVVNNTDIMILTIFGSLKTVSVYSVYNLVFGQLSTTIYSAFWQAPQASFGRIYNKDKKEFEHYYGIYETAFTVMLYIITAIALIMILPFVSIYTSGVTDINYIDFRLPILFGLWLSIFILDVSVHIFQGFFSLRKFPVMFSHDAD